MHYWRPDQWWVSKTVYPSVIHVLLLIPFYIYSTAFLLYVLSAAQGLTPPGQLQLRNLLEVQTIHALLSRLIPGVLCKEPCNPKGGLA